MTDEVRPPLRDEMPAYYRALPFANGLPSWEPVNAAWHGGSEPWPPPRQPATKDQLTDWADTDIEDPNYHPMAAFVDGTCVGASATISFRVTVPGGTSMPMAGVTGTGVIATHRRRGYLRRMMQTMFDDALQRGESLAMLSASEGSIYGRFGFSPATYRARLQIARQEAEFRPAPVDTGTLELVGADQARVAWPAVHENVRSMRVGELAPLPGHWDGLSDEADGTNGPLRYLVHRTAGGSIDGVANFRLPWSTSEANAGTLVVEALEATTPEAYRELWRLLLDFDLTRTVVAPGRPREEPLNWMLSNPRAVRTTRQSDNLWSRLLDVPAALAGRGYVLDDCLVLRIADDAMCPANAGAWELDTRGDAPICSATDKAPDATLNIQALSSLFFGGVSAHDLAYAGHIETCEPETVARLARLFQVDPRPHNSFGF